MLFWRENLGEAESTMQKRVLKRALERAGVQPEDVDYILAGDLLNQCIGSSSACGISEFHFMVCMEPVLPWGSRCLWQR